MSCRSTLDQGCKQSQLTSDSISLESIYNYAIETANPKPVTLATKHQANPDPYTPNPKSLSPKTLNPYTLNPESLSPKTLNPYTLKPKSLSPMPYALLLVQAKEEKRRQQAPGGFAAQSRLPPKGFGSKV